MADGNALFVLPYDDRMTATPPLAGLRVIELARVLAGPWAGQVLADLGASVVKVESLAGDDTRRWGPPSIENSDGSGDAAYFHSTNRGKRSIAVDLSRPEGQTIVQRLAAGADVLIENFKAGGLKKFGLDFDSLRRLNRRLVYCSITGFGQDGPYASRAGYDFVIQGMGGIMDLTGDASGDPQKTGVAFADVFTGLYAAIAIEAALLRRNQSGAGQWIDMALLDTQVGVLANQALNYLVSGEPPRRLGNAHPNIVPYQVFPVADGAITIAVGNSSQFRNCVAVLGLSDLADDPRYSTNEARVENRQTLVRHMSSATVRFTRNVLLAALESAAVPAGPINTVAEVFGDPQVIHRRMRIDVPRADGSRVPAVRTPILMSETPLAYERASPRVGEHTADILAELGYSQADIVGLGRDRVVRLGLGAP
jgi:crotonobetainyl-CoA:carnitine CoA-transferase CaiB-like acyl-CoA transferase